MIHYLFQLVHFYPLKLIFYEVFLGLLVVLGTAIIFKTQFKYMEGIIYSLISVILNICISVYYFKSIGFIIIPIATTISSWFNSIILFIYLKNRNLFVFNKIFLLRFSKIFFASIMTGIFFKYLISVFENMLVYNYHFKSFYLILSVFLGLTFYLILSLIIKAFKYHDIKLKY